ncbi:hypothetical protein IW261DRAFT_1606688 [Armillaria novae-zelandiae]|uniref:Protein kinase domain-containing protein n=1 Tax=Armillaria novae-zelandiae TaxID=153914 RepID=A0AA39PD28_9AGAR|nr:hypothetical protein IW261DRAFT_1606688 [Armillaria novae-zelandiae]
MSGSHSYQLYSSRRITPPQSERQSAQIVTADSSPIKSQINNEYTSVKVPATELRKDLWKDMEGHWVGPMPVQEFLDDFLRVPGLEGGFHSPTHLHGIFDSITPPAKYGSEKLYAEAVNASIQGVASELIPNFQFVLGNEFKDANATSKTVTDGFMYESTVDASSSSTQWDKAKLWAEFKRRASYHGFKDARDDGWVPDTLNAQHRKYLFSLFLGLDGVRLFKWKRTYPVASRAFDLTTDGKYLVEFLYRFCTLTDGDRGKDDTVTPATEEEIALAKEFLNPWIHASDPPRPFVKIRVFGLKGNREVIAGPHIATPRRITGRAMLALPVYDIETKTVMFLKDSWPDANLPQESEILETLQKAGVRNVPTFVCGGVVDDQKTTSDTYIEKEWNDGAHPAIVCIRLHQRTLTKEVGQPLSRFKSSRQLTRVVYDAFLGHEDAFTKCGYLHRDISGGNILIIYDAKAPKDKGDGGGRGLLNDWDMAIEIANLTQARQTERTGTWQFMSIALLRDRTKKHEPQDDFESFVYVMLFYGLCYLRHNEIGPDLPNVVSAIFDAARNIGHAKRGGSGKAALVHGLGELSPDFRFDSDPFDSWMKSALVMIRQWQLHLTVPVDDTSAALKPPAETVKFMKHDGLRIHWEKMLDMKGWPSADEVHFYEPQFVSKRHKSTHSSAAAPSANAETPGVERGADEQA